MNENGETLLHYLLKNSEHYNKFDSLIELLKKLKDEKIGNFENRVVYYGKSYSPTDLILSICHRDLGNLSYQERHRNLIIKIGEFIRDNNITCDKKLYKRIYRNKNDWLAYAVFHSTN